MRHFNHKTTATRCDVVIVPPIYRIKSVLLGVESAKMAKAAPMKRRGTRNTASNHASSTTTTLIGSLKFLAASGVIKLSENDLIQTEKQLSTLGQDSRITVEEVKDLNMQGILIACDATSEQVAPQLDESERRTVAREWELVAARDQHTKELAEWQRTKGLQLLSSVDTAYNVPFSQKGLKPPWRTGKKHWKTRTQTTERS